MNKYGRLAVILCIAAAATSGILLSLKIAGIPAENSTTLQMQPVFNQEEDTGIEDMAHRAASLPADVAGSYDGTIPERIGNTASVEKKEPVLVEYKGAIRHIFFHPLILYPEMAFDGDSISQGYNEWFVTVREFEKILDSLYLKDYILVDMSQLYKLVEHDGEKRMEKKKLLLPEGKKPLIISVDDVNYYEYMKENGNAHKLVLDAGGNVAAYSISPEGQEKIERGNEVIPILDEFVKQHPDFSLEGSKGILALTGYAGILGYRTENTTAATYEKEKEEALKVIRRLKETGWTFACHGYGHLHSNKVSFDRLKEDTLKWKAEVEPLIGPVSIYIYPYGEEVPIKNPKFRMLMDEGFNIFCPVGNTGFQIVTDKYVQMDRMNIDGTAFYYNKEKLSDMFDVDSVIDSIRPPLKQN
jgi:hypothetical protein